MLITCFQSGVKVIATVFEKPKQRFTSVCAVTGQVPMWDNQQIEASGFFLDGSINE